MDGIDAALFTIKPRAAFEPGGGRAPDLDFELIHSALHPFESAFQRRLLSTVASESVSWEQVCLLNTALGECFADAAMQLIRESRKSGVARVDLIGSHGQTLWHAPVQKSFWGVRTHGTLQLGEPAIISARTGLPVVADFRTADMSMGGEGAPLVSFADEVLFGQSGIPTGVLNIGGIANITVLDGNGGALMAFDTGPGNMLIDRASQALAGTAYDANGDIARQGKVNQELLTELSDNAYFKRVPPKTTGRELFGFAYADHAIARAQMLGLSTADCLATLTAFTASSVANSYRDFALSRVQIERLVVGGGGAENSFLLELIAKYWPHPIKISKHEEFGISTKFKESLLFALLAYTTYFQIPNNVPACTGASKRVCLGKIVAVAGNFV